MHKSQNPDHPCLLHHIHPPVRPPIPTDRLNYIGDGELKVNTDAVLLHTQAGHLQGDHLLTWRGGGGTGDRRQLQCQHGCTSTPPSCHFDRDPLSHHFDREPYVIYVQRCINVHDEVNMSTVHDTCSIQHSKAMERMACARLYWCCMLWSIAQVMCIHSPEHC